MDLSNLGQSFAQGGLLDSISGLVGGRPDATKKTLSAAVPTTMYALADHGSSEIGARGLLEGLRSGQAPQLDASELKRTLGDPRASAQLLTASNGFLERTLGGKLDSIIGGLSSFGGADRGVTTKLVALAAPLVLGLIGRHARENQLDAKGLAAFLGEQKSKVASMVPGPLRSLFEGARTPSEEVGRLHEGARASYGAERPRDVQQHRSPWVWALPLLVLIGLGWLLAQRGRMPNAPLAPSVATERASMRTVSDYLASGQAAARRFSFDGFTFAPRRWQLSSDGERSARDLATVLKTHPAATVRVEGYGDSMGTANANRSLSHARADAVKQALVANGVNGDRIETAGMGPVRRGSRNERQVEVLIRSRRT
jgi:outer membrane protein OmpA-like peptidoglycan-associated protein